MSSIKKNQQDYEAILKNYERAQAQFTRTQLSKKDAKKNLKKAIKGDATKSEVELLRLELDIAKAKCKARKAGVAIAKTHIKQWIKANAKGKKSYKLTIKEYSIKYITVFVLYYFTHYSPKKYNDVLRKINSINI